MYSLIKENIKYKIVGIWNVNTLLETIQYKYIGGITLILLINKLEEEMWIDKILIGQK